MHCSELDSARSIMVSLLTSGCMSRSGNNYGAPRTLLFAYTHLISNFLISGILPHELSLFQRDQQQRQRPSLPWLRPLRTAGGRRQWRRGSQGSAPHPGVPQVVGRPGVADQPLLPPPVTDFQPGHLSVYLSIYISVILHIYLFPHLSIYISVLLHIYLLPYPSIYLPTFLSIFILSNYQSIMNLPV